MFFRAVSAKAFAPVGRGFLCGIPPRAFFPRFALKASPSSPSGPGLCACWPFRLLSCHKFIRSELLKQCYGLLASFLLFCKLTDFIQ